MRTSDDQMDRDAESRRLSTADLASVQHRTQAEAEGLRTGAEAPVGRGADSSPQPLFPADDAERFRSEWTDIQTQFVDEPRHAVERGDELVAQVVQRLAENFATERANLEQQWDRGGDVSTEELRIALQRYRSFFERLLAA
jgi:hypothetical protein